MSEEHQIVSVVYAAKEDVERAEAMLRDYMPFIRSEASKCLSRFCTDQDDALSIAMMAFHEAILGYDKSRGAFLSYAALRIRSRIIDWQRKEARHQGQISLDTAADEEAQPLREQLADERDPCSSDGRFWCEFQRCCGAFTETGPHAGSLRRGRALCQRQRGAA